MINAINNDFIVVRCINYAELARPQDNTKKYFKQNNINIQMNKNREQTIINPPNNFGGTVQDKRLTQLQTA